MKSLYILIILLTISTFAFAQSEFLDSTFSDDGFAKFPVISDTSIDYNKAYSATIQSDGKIIVSGGTSSKHGNIIKYSSNGFLDSTFGNLGSLYYPNVCIQSVNVQSDDKIVYLRKDSTYNGFSMERLDNQGLVDSTFGNNGNIAFPWLFEDIRFHIKVQSDDKILIAANTNINKPYIFRLTADGVLDSTFAINGELYITVLGGEIRNLLIQEDEKILLVGRSGNNINLVRLNDDGSFDNSFGVNGISIYQRPGVQHPADLTLNQDSSIYVSSWDYYNIGPPFTWQHIIVKFKFNGELDLTFGDNGIMVTPLTIEYDDIENNIISIRDKVVLMGEDGFKTRIEQYCSSGSRFNLFGNNGKIDFNFIQKGATIHLLDNDQILITGTVSNQYVITRLKPLDEISNDIPCPINTGVPTPIDTTTYPIDTSSVDTTLFDFNLNIFPNPIETEGFITYELTEQSNINCYILNGLGQIVQIIKQNEPKDAGKYLEPITIQELPRRSVYYLWLDDGKRHTVRPFLLKEK